jgi:hypothetical protein
MLYQLSYAGFVLLATSFGGPDVSPYRTFFLLVKIAVLDRLQVLKWLRFSDVYEPCLTYNLVSLSFSAKLQLPSRYNSRLSYNYRLIITLG